MKYFLLAALVLLGFSACDKAENPPTREDELRQGKWKKVAGTIRKDPAIGPDVTTNYFEELAPCKKDDYIIFRTNFDASQFSGDKCDLSEPDEIPFRWELYNNGNGINFWNANQTFFDQAAVSAPFLSYTSERFTIRYTEYPRNETDTLQRDTVTYTHTFGKF
jgi:hypothetical protein